MKSSYSLKLIFTFFSILFLLNSFRYQEEQSEYLIISKRFEIYLDSCQDAITNLEAIALGYKNNNDSIESLQLHFTKTRLAYKKIEFILAYYYSDFIKSKINGAPLLHVEKTGTTHNVINPEGLQILDELIFSNEANTSKKEIAYLTTKLKNNFSLLYNRIKATSKISTIQPLMMKLELIRIASLGITGFDTPGSQNGINESKVVLEAMKLFLIDKKEYKQNNTLPLFENAISFLNQTHTFENFDRFTFIKEFLNPLYQELELLKQYNNNEDVQIIKATSAWNPKSTSLFSNDFLNPYFFTEIKDEEDNTAIRSLGKDLFYDTILSNNGSLSCVSCHDPKKAFTDGHKKSLSAIQGKTVVRNSPTLLNAVYSDRFFYDLRAFTLEQQIEHVIFSSDEFNTSYNSILERLNAKKEYQIKSKKAFGKTLLNRENFRKALASYVLSLHSFNSPFDKYIKLENTSVPSEIKEGFNLFMGKANCATCHFAPTFSGLVPPFYNESESEILGVLENPNAVYKTIDSDLGRMGNTVSYENVWIYEKSFKTPTLRNIEFTAPYFHNGAYKTLEEVIEFYNEGGGEGLGYTVKNQTLSPEKLYLSKYEKKALIAFLKSLSDSISNKDKT
ncbi:cytochrome-c peroxidase [Flavobacterium sp. J27]|uniref:cytochrome-c peroxidase n=1 Tax=Flavobacterium sp. J27 TaxID=2060419 RepID=UPI00102FAA1A|nr:cytochrome c peroxidase [Flavobacterium sp. J27]